MILALRPTASLRECDLADPGETARLLDLIRLGDGQARSRLIAHTCERLRRLTSHMLRTYPTDAKF